MLFLLSPAKSLDYDTATPATVARRATLPQYLGQSAELIKRLRTFGVAELAALMGISTALSELNVVRFRSWSNEFTATNSKPALLAFNGDVYGGLEASSLRVADLDWAQRHLLILSGLYGVLRPLDLLQPYRLEMGTSLANAHGANLYDFWGDALAAHVSERCADDRLPVVVNLASQEYFRAVDRPALKSRVIDCVFEDWKTDRYKIIGFHAKRARGLMARHAITARVATVAALKKFDAEGYAYAAAASAPDRLVFRRKLG